MNLPGKSRGLLNSWKEISAYLGRGVRTAQRWERHGLPIRRVARGPRASVIAHTNEIDAWLKSARSRVYIPQTNPRNRNLFAERASAPRDQLYVLRQRGRKQLQRLVHNVNTLTANIRGQSTYSVLSFVRIELDLAKTFVAISKSSEQTRSLRNRKNARTAFDTVVHFWGKVQLSPEQDTEIRQKLTTLKEQLRQLGESF
jgi:hypothetical protein